ACRHFEALPSRCHTDGLQATDRVAVVQIGERGEALAGFRVRGAENVARVGHAARRPYSALMFESRMTWPHFACSARMNAANAADVLATGSRPYDAKYLRASSVSRIVA